MPPRDLKKAQRNSAGHRSLVNAVMVASGDKAGGRSRVVVGLSQGRGQLLPMGQEHTSRGVKTGGGGADEGGRG